MVDEMKDSYRGVMRASLMPRPQDGLGTGRVVT